MGFGIQLKLLLWKNFKLRARHPFRQGVELVWPLVLFIILAWVRTRNLKEPRAECHYDGRPMPSAGPLPFMQGVVCYYNNTCHQNMTNGELPGTLETFNTSLLSEFFVEFETFLGNETEVGTLVQILEDLNTLNQLQQQLVNGTADCTFEVRDVLVNTQDIQGDIVRQNISLSVTTIPELLNATLNFTELIQVITSNPNPGTIANQFRDVICDNSTRETLLIFPSVNITDDVISQLCELTVPEFIELFNDFQNDLNYTALLAQANTCAQSVAGNTLNADTGTIEAGTRLYENAQEIQSIGSLVSMLNETFAGLLNSAPGLLNSSRESQGSFINTFFCGGRSINLLAANNPNSESSNKTNEEVLPLDVNPDTIVDNSTYRCREATTPVCMEVVRSLQSTAGGRIFWRQLKPMLCGKLLYTPDTPATRRIIQEANSTFEYLHRFSLLAEDWLKVSPNVSNFLATSQEIETLRSSVKVVLSGTPEGQIRNQLQIVDQLLYNGPKTNESAYDWRDALENVDDLMRTVKQYMECFELNKWEGKATEGELVNTGLRYIDNGTLWAGVVFELDGSTTDDSLPTHIKFKIRVDTGRTDDTRRVKQTYWRPWNRARSWHMKYLNYGWAYIQDMIEHGIIRLQTNMSGDIGVEVQQFPHPCWTYDRFTNAISRSMPMFMTLAWIYTVSMVVKGIVYEKEQRLKEVMKVMGLSNGIHWLAWFITSSIMMLLSTILLVIILKVGNVVEYSDGSVVFVFMFAYTMATVAQCFCISVFFSRANLAAASAGIIYFCCYLPYPLCTRFEEYMKFQEKFLASLLSPVAFGFGCSYMAQYEEQGLGIQWNNIAVSPMPEDDFSMLGAIMMMFFDAFLYLFITWYVEAVFPGQYGVPRPWYFFATKSYWCGSRSQDRRDYSAPQGLELGQNQDTSEEFEKEPTRSALGVSIRNMSKQYSRGKKMAVNGLSLNFYEDQITSFLGHNGAGKTTTMSILTGLFPPTSGTALIYGQDIRTEIDAIRKSMGMCPQHNVLFDDLTVAEHLWFYSRMKGMEEAEVQKETKKMIQEIGLPHKTNALAKTLSGGMKRKLSVGIAFTAGSKVVILDEPTAGVDPYARRSIWELLLHYRKGRTIILSTHFMDEADILGDRVAIISQGQLRCCGSSLFLKARFGSGYYLTVVKKEIDPSTDERTEKSMASLSEVKVKQDERVEADQSDGSDSGFTEISKTNSTESYGDFDPTAITDFVVKGIPDSKLVENIGTELTFQLPEDGARSGSFEKLFTELDGNLQRLGISSYGISDTTLEEVFLKVAEETGVDELPEEEKRSKVRNTLTDGGAYAAPVTRMSFRSKARTFLGIKNPKDQCHLLNNRRNPNRASDFELDGVSMTSDADSVMADAVESCNGAGSYRVEGMGLVARQFWALLVKRFHNVRRSKKGFISEVILPSVFICLAMVFSMLNPPTPQMPPLEIHPWVLEPTRSDDPLFTFFTNDRPDLQWSNDLQDAMLDKPGLGCRCMDPSIYSIEDYPCKSDSYDVKRNMWTARPEIVNTTTQCSCGVGLQQCPDGAAGPDPSHVTLPTGETMYNMTGRNVTDWILKTVFETKYRRKRYGGISVGEINDLVQVNDSVLEDSVHRILTAVNGGERANVTVTLPDVLTDLEDLLELGVTQRNGKVWFNNRGYPAMVSYMNVFSNMVLRANLPAGKDPSKYGISVVNHPMNRTQEQLEDYLMRAGARDVLIAISVIFALSFIPASFILFLVDERVSNAKHLQFVSGVNPTTYWVANFTWDMLNYFIPTLICFLIFVAFGQEAFVSAANAPCTLALLLLYGVAVTPLMYPASFFFKVPSSAFVGLSCLNVFLGIVSTISTYIIELLADDDEELLNINNILTKVFLILPHYCLGRGLIDMARNQLVSDTYASLGENYFQNPLQWDLVGKNLFCLVVEGFVFFLLTLCVQYGFWINKIKKYVNKWRGVEGNRNKKLPPIEEEDVDVARERQRITLGGSSDDVLKIDELTKIYDKRKNKGKRPAVDRICVGVRRGECFGLLGVNGAGKTSTFKMLTGDTDVTSGNAILDDHSILTDMVSVRQHLGYCPQFDAIFPLLTGREHLKFFARLRGVPEKDVKTVAEWGIRRLGLLQHSEKCAGDYSGGNKRKLSTAIALVGNPPVIFLDEPTTGMDPKARRFLWDCISNILKDGRSVVLTSHSMEECEALCSRIAIMVNGTFKCLGSVQHLKNRFGDGYTVIVRVSGQDPDMQPLMSFIEATFPSAELKEQHHNMLQYQLGSSTLCLAAAFGKLEAIRDEYNIEDYSISQTTLDQVFINFAKQQTELLDDEIEAAKVTSSTEAPSGGGAVLFRNPREDDEEGPVDGRDRSYDWGEPSLRGSSVQLVPPTGAAQPAQQRQGPPHLPDVSDC